MNTSHGNAVFPNSHCQAAVIATLNSANCLKQNVSEEKLMALSLSPDSALFDEREKAALHCAEVVTVSNWHCDASLVTKLQQHFSDDAIIELTAPIAYKNVSSKFDAVLGVPAHGFCAAASAMEIRRWAQM